MFTKSCFTISLTILLSIEASLKRKPEDPLQDSWIDIIDLSHPTTWKGLADFYGSVEKNWKICVNCGIPELGTAIHFEHASVESSMKPAVVPTEYLLTRLEIIDVTYLAIVDPGVTLTLEVALQWPVLKQDPRETTMILFKFGWKRTKEQRRQCVCKIPGLSYELAEWIASNLTNVVGVATDAPTLESEQTRDFTVRTVSTLLGKNGIYVIENVNIRAKLPEHSCLAIAMPLRLLEASYVPTRLTAFCPSSKPDHKVTLALKKEPLAIHNQKRAFDVNLNEILN